MQENNLLIMRGNLRKDLDLIYEEVVNQAIRLNIKHNTVYPASLTLKKRENAFGFLIGVASAFSLIFTPLFWKIRDKFIGKKIRLWSLIDFLYFYRHFKKSNTNYLFILNRRHSEGACLAAEIQNIKIITHQHGDYYNENNIKKYGFRDIEGKSTRLIWNENASENIKRHSLCEMETIISGSLKHIAVHKRKTAEIENSNGVVFYDTISKSTTEDEDIARKVSSILNKIENITNHETAVKLHPIRAKVKKNNRDNVIINIYRSNNIKYIIDPESRNKWGISIDSNALYDHVSSGLPCIYLKSNNSALGIKAEYPGCIELDDPEAPLKIASLIKSNNAENLALIQHDFLQTTVIGNINMVDEAFNKIFTKNKS